MQRKHAQIMKITNGFFNPISAFAQTNLIIELKLTVYLFSKKLGMDQNFFSGQHESYNIYFFCRTKREFFSQNLTLGYMTKTLKQIFFPSTKIRIFFSVTLGIRIFV
jgi:hypothetical protein